jgi:hypothetical protein
MIRLSAGNLFPKNVSDFVFKAYISYLERGVKLLGNNRKQQIIGIDPLSAEGSRRT